MRDDDVLRGALECQVEGQRKKGRLKRSWRKQVEEEGIGGLNREDVLCRSKWSVGFNQIARRFLVSLATILVGDTTGL